mgnify:CR=1 FL=1
MPGTRPAVGCPFLSAAVKANIDAYFALYGRNLISGIFLDEMASDTRQLEFYREIYNYIKGKDASLRVLGNPGMIPAEAFSSVADQLVTFEGTAAQYQNYDPRTNATWLYSLANTRQASLVHNADTCTAMQAMVRAAASGRSAVAISGRRSSSMARLCA